MPLAGGPRPHYRRRTRGRSAGTRRAVPSVRLVEAGRGERRGAVPGRRVRGASRGRSSTGPLGRATMSQAAPGRAGAGQGPAGSTHRAPPAESQDSRVSGRSASQNRPRPRAAAQVRSSSAACRRSGWKRAVGLPDQGADAAFVGVLGAAHRPDAAGRRRRSRRSPPAGHPPVRSARGRSRAPEVSWPSRARSVSSAADSAPGGLPRPP